MGDLVFNPSSTDSDLILLSAGLVDLTQANSITFVGDELGIDPLILWRSSRSICMRKTKFPSVPWTML